MTALEVTSFAGYSLYLGIVFGWRSLEVKRRTGGSAWRKPVSRTDTVGESLCGLGCLASLGAPILAVTGLAKPADLGGVGLRLVFTLASVVLAIVLGLWAQHHLASDWRAGVEASSTLVTTGPFTRVRNPFYLACFAASSGVFVALPSTASALAVGLQMVAAEVIVRGVEEPLLARVFGQDFERYRKTTGRFVPSLRP